MEQQSTAPPEIRNVVNFLRGSSSGMKTRVGILNGKRLDYFKGKHVCEFEYPDSINLEGKGRAQ